MQLQLREHGQPGLCHTRHIFLDDTSIDSVASGSTNGIFVEMFSCATHSADSESMIALNFSSKNPHVTNSFSVSAKRHNLMGVQFRRAGSSVIGKACVRGCNVHYHVCNHHLVHHRISVIDTKSLTCVPKYSSLQDSSSSHARIENCSRE